MRGDSRLDTDLEKDEVMLTRPELRRLRVGMELGESGPAMVMLIWTGQWYSMLLWVPRILRGLD